MINWTQVKSLRNDIGFDEFDEVVELFLEEVEGIIDKLRLEPKFGELESDMHFLKGCAMNLGFSTFSQMCQTGEKMSADGNAQDVDIPEILNCFDLSKTTFLTEVTTAFHD